MSTLEMYQEIVNLLARGESAVLTTLVSSGGSSPREPGARMLVRQDGSIAGTVGGGSVEYQVCQKAREVMASGQSQLVHFNLNDEVTAICGGYVDIFLEPLIPPETLFILGAGHVGQATARIGKSLGFRTVVIDPRPSINSPARFPTADSLVVEQYVAALQKAHLDKNSYIVICTPGHAFDEESLHVAVLKEVAYLGMIGSKKKVKEVKEHLLAKGVSQDNLDRVHAPIGLDIGAETPEEIAVSIMAEIVKIKRGKGG